jgi:hypothetical protein
VSKDETKIVKCVLPVFAIATVLVVGIFSASWIPTVLKYIFTILIYIACKILFRKLIPQRKPF